MVHPEPVSVLKAERIGHGYKIAHFVIGSFNLVIMEVSTNVLRALSLAIPTET